LQQSGWIEGRNLQIDFRWPAADIAVMATHAEELVELKPDVILSHPLGPKLSASLLLYASAQFPSG
jgi:hypothetical protein